MSSLSSCLVLISSLPGLSSRAVRLHLPPGHQAQSGPPRPLCAPEKQVRGLHRRLHSLLSHPSSLSCAVAFLSLSSLCICFSSPFFLRSNLSYLYTSPHLPVFSHFLSSIVGCFLLGPVPYSNLLRLQLFPQQINALGRLLLHLAATYVISSFSFHSILLHSFIQSIAAIYPPPITRTHTHDARTHALTHTHTHTLHTHPVC